jgi:hypothetical protein
MTETNHLWFKTGSYFGTDPYFAQACQFLRISNATFGSIIAAVAM